MELTEEDVREFIDIWKKEFGETLSPADARHEAGLLVQIYTLIARPIPDVTSSTTDSLTP